MRVAIGPRHELHVGVHGSLLTSPPAGIEYVLAPYDVRFLHRASRRSRPFSPAHDYALAEWIRFRADGADFAVAHSARLPVEGRTPWVVDADSLLATLKVGSFFALGSPERFVDGEVERRDVRLRAAMMLSRYCSTACSAVLLLTEHARAELMDYAAGSGLLPKAATEALARKCRVVHAAVTPPPAAENARRVVPSILYMAARSRTRAASLPQRPCFDCGRPWRRLSRRPSTTLTPWSRRRGASMSPSTRSGSATFRGCQMAREDFTAPVVTGTTTHFVTARAAARRMIEQGSGVILTLSASAARSASSPEPWLGMGGFGVACAASRRGDPS